MTLYFGLHRGLTKGRETLPAFSILTELICAVWEFIQGIQGSHEILSGLSPSVSLGDPGNKISDAF